MNRIPRLLLVTAAVLTAGLVGVASASACGGADGYSYAGVSATSNASGISAFVDPLGPFDVLNGHVAGWVGVGGPGEGPNGTDEWLQIGVDSLPGLLSDVYYEVELPNQPPVYHQVQANPVDGQPVKVSVLEMFHRTNWWRVWENGHPVSPPIYLPQSHHRWTPIATAESWDGGTGGACNAFLYSFRQVAITASPGGNWHQLVNTYPISSSGETKLRRGGSSFLAAEGQAAFRTLASLKP
jgi:hypothetical protein